MLRLLLLTTLFCAPLAAVTPTGNPALKGLELGIRLSADGDNVAADVHCVARIYNEGDAADIELSLPHDVIPRKQHKAFTLHAGESDLKPARSAHGRWYWTLHFDTGQTIAVGWGYTTTAAVLPQANVLGRRVLTVPLRHMQGYSALPEKMRVEIDHTGLAPSLFGRESGDRISLSVPVGKHVQDYTLKWLATTPEAARAELVKARDAFGEAQRTAENRAYTEVLVRLSEVDEIMNDQQALADTCANLAALEKQAGHSISHCGPWAQWRKYIPWRLRRLRALRALKQDASECARLAVAEFKPRWEAYLVAKKNPRPFDHFDIEKFGNYWDYDWPATRDLYAIALELSGDAEAAKQVRATATDNS